MRFSATTVCAPSVLRFPGVLRPNSIATGNPVLALFKMYTAINTAVAKNHGGEDLHCQGATLFDARSKLDLYNFEFPA